MTSLRDLDCFVQVARTRNFSRAAARLGLSQSAVSQAVARLERGLELRLFERTSRDVRLTAPGTALLPEAEVVLKQAAEFAKAAERLAAPAESAISLTYDPIVGALAAQVARATGAGLHPGGWTATTAGLAEGRTSIALMTTPFPPDLAATARFHVPVTHVAVPASDPLSTASLVQPRQLDGHRLLLHRGLRGWRDGVEIDDLPAALDLVAAGGGLLPVPRLIVETVRRADVRFLPLAGASLRLTFGLVWRRENASADLLTVVNAVQRILRARTPGYV